MNVRVFNPISRVNETRLLVQHEMWECKCGLNESVYIWLKKNGIMMNVGVCKKLVVVEFL